MIITLKEGQKSHLSLLFSKPPNVIQEFTKIALEHLLKGPNLKLYAKVAQKLSVEAEIIQNSVEGLINLLLECCKHQLSEIDLRDTMLTIGFNEEQSKILVTLYNSEKQVLLRVLTERTVDFPQFKDIQWRVEAQVASRALLEQMTPQVTMQLSLDSSSGPEQVLLTSDPATLVHLTEQLEAALAESKSQHFRRIQRRFKS